MRHPPLTEAELDSALAKALRDQPAFAAWFLGRTRFAEEGGQCVLVRADNPWSRVTLSIPDPVSGVRNEVRQDRETDILAIFATPTGRRIALHIENKLADGTFTFMQPQSYKARLEQWRLRARLGSYVEATSVLVAPQVFYDRNRAAAELFEAFVAHESIAEYVPVFAR